MTVPEVIAELRAARDGMQDAIEGFRDILLLNTSNETKAAAQFLLDAFNGRVTHLDNSLSALEGLKNHGYPELPDREVVDAVIADVNRQLETISAAKAFFAAPELAAALNLQPGTIGPK